MLRPLLVALVMTFFGGAAFAAESSKAYPGVFDRPSDKPAAITKDEQLKLKDELTRSRDRTNSKATTQRTTSGSKEH
jgi:hypothetical protein